MRKTVFIIRNEGIAAFCKRAFLFLRHRIFFSRKYYLYAARLDEVSRELQPLKVENITVRVVSTNQELRELSGGGLIFKPWSPEYRSRLDKGAIAFCAFDGIKLVHVSWCAMTEKAMKSLREPPYKVDFANHEAANGDYWTHPEYRGKNISHLVTRTRQQYMREKGIITTHGAIPLDNRASQKIPRYQRSRVYATGHHIKILWWQYWEETPSIAGDKPPVQ